MTTLGIGQLTDMAQQVAAALRTGRTYHCGIDEARALDVTGPGDPVVSICFEGRWFDLYVKEAR